MKKVLLISFFSVIYCQLYAQEADQPAQVEHVEPVVFDFTSDPGNRQGDHEVNLNLDYEHRNFSGLETEFELGIFDRVGLEIEVPFTVDCNECSNSNIIPSITGTLQYTFLVSESNGISLAANYQAELEFSGPEESNIIEEVMHFPYLLAAKNFSDKYFLVLAGGPQIQNTPDESDTDINGFFNIAFHRTIFSRYYAGLEINAVTEKDDIELSLRPQVIAELIEEKLNLGIAAGIPLHNTQYDWEAFARLAYEF